MILIYDRISVVMSFEPNSSSCDLIELSSDSDSAAEESPFNFDLLLSLAFSFSQSTGLDFYGLIMSWS
jgi:hypothetical protein